MTDPTAADAGQLPAFASASLQVVAAPGAATSPGGRDISIWLISCVRSSRPNVKVVAVWLPAGIVVGDIENVGSNPCVPGHGAPLPSYEMVDTIGRTAGGWPLHGVIETLPVCVPQV